MTLDALRAYGANTGEGLARCMNNDANHGLRTPLARSFSPALTAK